MTERIRLRTGHGPVGTGVFLLGCRRAGADEWVARCWVCCFFLPILPLRAARFHGPASGTIGEGWEVEQRTVEAQHGGVGRTYAVAVGALLLALAPVAYAWWTIHQTGLLQAFKVVGGAAAPILVLMWLDTRIPRISQ